MSDRGICVLYNFIYQGLYGQIALTDFVLGDNFGSRDLSALSYENCSNFCPRILVKIKA